MAKARHQAVETSEDVGKRSRSGVVTGEKLSETLRWAENREVRNRQVVCFGKVAGEHHCTSLAEPSPDRTQP